MNPNFLSSSSFLLVLLSALLVFDELPQCQSFFDGYTSCSNNFSCGPKITNIDFPFWGEARPPGCGHRDLKLNCESGKPTISIKGVKYNVLELKQETHDLKIARADFSDGICKPNIRNTDWDLKLFEFAPLPELIDITLFYNCSSDAEYIPGVKFKCGDDEDGLIQLVPEAGNEVCNSSVTVRVPVGKFKDFDWSGSSTTIVEEALKEGFHVKYKVDFFFPACDECRRSKGVCGNDLSSNQPTCYCQNDKAPVAIRRTCRPPSPPAPVSEHGVPPQQAESKADGNGKGSLPTGTGLSIAGACILGIGIGLYVFFLINRRKKKRALLAQSKDLPPTPSSKSLITPSTNFSQSIPSYPSSKSDIEKGSFYFGVQVFSYSELEEATDNFDASRELGEGGFGTVYYGKLHDGRVVAVKRLFENNFKRVEQFMNEVEILTRLGHKNLVKLYGCTSRRSRELLLVYEFIPNGTVADHLHGKKNSSDGFLSWPVRLSIAIETADALAYLHRSDIIHRDVKTNNILLDNEFQVKVADFGLSRLFPTDVTHVSTAPQGTPGYVDPEYYQCYQLTSKSDVYSFGVVLIELISSLPAVDTNRHRHDINLANMAINKIQNHALNELVDPSLGFDKDYNVRRMATAVAELAFRCLQQEKDMRPTMDEVVAALKAIENQEFGSQTAEVVDIRSDDVGLLKNMPPPFSPDSIVNAKWVSSSTQSMPPPISPDSVVNAKWVSNSTPPNSI